MDASQGLEQAASLLREHDVHFVDLQFVDVVGAVKSVTVPASDPVIALSQPAWVDGSSLEGAARFAETDMYLRPDVSTLAIMPNGDGRPVARVMCDVLTPNGEPFLADPRQVLRRAQAVARQHHLSYQVTPEIEFFLCHRDDRGALHLVPNDAAGYFDKPIGRCAKVVDEIMAAARVVGVRIATAHHEIAPSQYEIDLQMGDALEVADAIVTLKSVARHIASKHDLQATFMPKPFLGYAGSGMHTHQVLSNAHTGHNALDEAGQEYDLSKLGRHFIAGQLAHARGMCAILAPLANSYKRLIHAYEAPVYITWARINHAALLRVPQGVSGKANASTLELRCLDCGANPYLAFAVMLRAGLDGIETAADPPAPVEEHLHDLARSRLEEMGVAMLPTSLEEALQELEWDPIVRDALGPEVYDTFTAAKMLEWNEYRRQLTTWEIERYRDI